MTPGRETLMNSETMLLEIERLDSVVQLHFEPRKWSPDYYKFYMAYLSDLEKQLKQDGVDLIIEGIKTKNTKKRRLIRMFGFKELEAGEYTILYKQLGGSHE
jgi:deoxyribodipyrimidine photolyase